MFREIFTSVVVLLSSNTISCADPWHGVAKHYGGERSVIEMSLYEKLNDFLIALCSP